MESFVSRSAPEQPKWREAISSESLIHGKYADRFELKWKIPAHNGEPIDVYEITYCPVSFHYKYDLIFNLDLNSSTLGSCLKYILFM